MSIFNVIRRADDDFVTLQYILTYVVRAAATMPEYIYGVGVSEWDSYRQMMLVKRDFGQEDGKAYYHYVLNPDFSDYEGLTERRLFEISLDIANLIANFYGRFQVVDAVHFDTEWHLHFIANNIDLLTGERFDLSPSRLEELKLEVNKILDKAGISPVPVSSHENNGQ